MDMSLLILGGGLLAAFLGHEIFSDDDDDDNDNTAADGVTDDDVKVDDDFAGGNNGDNEIVQTVTADGVENFMTAYGAGGNDTITMVSGGSAYGGAGDDVLDIQDKLPTFADDPWGPGGLDLWDRDTIDGGAGNDTINVESVVDTQINGGTGNDSISYVENDYEDAALFAVYGPNDIDAGAGNDVVDAEIEVALDHNPLGVTLGAGNDTLTLEMDMDDIFIGGIYAEQHLFHGAETSVVVTDFNPDEDVLVVEVDTDPEDTTSDYAGQENPTLTYEGVTVTELNGDTYVTINYSTNLSDPDNTAGVIPEINSVTSTIVLQDITGVPASAIKIVTG